MNVPETQSAIRSAARRGNPGSLSRTIAPVRPDEVRGLALADVTAERLTDLINHGEDLVVERKREPPGGPKFGAEVASLANMLGGFVLIGVTDGKRIVGYETPPRTDLQSHIGNVLRRAVSPVPPFLIE